MNSNKKMIVTAIAATLVPALSAQAQQTDRVLAPVTASVDREVEVQARTELGTLTAYTPISGAVVSREEIEALQFVDSLRELTTRVPGVSLIRNMRIPDGGKNYTDMRVDGMRTSYSQTYSLVDQANISNIERVEFITGPGSALNSSYAIGGTMNVVTRDPPRTLSGSLSQEAGDWEFNRTQFSLGNTLGNGLGFFLAGSNMETDGWRRNSSAEQHKQGLSGKLVFRPTDRSRLSLGLDHVDWDFRLPGSLNQAQFDADWRGVVPKSYGRTLYTFDTGSLEFQQMVGERGELRLAASLRNTRQEGRGGTGSGASGGAITNSTNRISLNEEDNTVIQGWYRQEFDWLKSTLYVGVEKADMQQDGKTFANQYSLAQAQQGLWAMGAQTSAGSIGTEESLTPYLHYEVSPTARLRLHLGERFDHIRYITDDRTAANKDGEKTFSKAVFKSGLTYDLNPGHLLWANLSQGFVAPGLSNLMGGTTSPANYDLKPEESWTQEIGLRGTFKGERALHYDIALFNTINKNIIVSRDCTAAELLALPTCTSAKENAAKVTARGLESMFDLNVTHWLDVGATYSYSQVFYNDYVSGTTTSGFTDYSGNDYQAAPRHNLNLRLGFKPAPGWKAELELSHISDYWIHSSNNFTYSRPDLLNLRVSYDRKDWKFWLHVLNLTDRKYADRVAYGTLDGMTGPTYGTVGNSGTYQPLTLRAGVSYKF